MKSRLLIALALVIFAQIMYVKAGQTKDTTSKAYCITDQRYAVLVHSAVDDTLHQTTDIGGLFSFWAGFDRSKLHTSRIQH
jgi:hypothetical protein